MDYAKIKASYYRAKRRAYLNHKYRRYHVRNHLNLVRFSNRCGNHLNCIRFSLGESLLHIYKKVEICCWLLEMKHDFLTEAIFLNGSRCDVLDITEGVVYEILHSETEEQLLEKIRKYPPGVGIMKVRC
ncbi:hypothetical protein HYS50_03055 [Candidatus Woesearchaeota archaeon]|nr:hypothetical protein [Candidatus Woesearchaeota archaeon]